jgi:hypothetical protein
MLQDLLSYQKDIQTVLHTNHSDTDWMKELEIFKVRFLYLQIERMIHLVVTMTVGLATLLACFASIQLQMVSLYVLDSMLIVLFFAYILHYRKLENTAQSWYRILNELQKKISD